MAIRPDNHIIGDKAVRKISNNLIPEEWTISTPESDYGLDMLIEVVHNNQTTGRLFFYTIKRYYRIISQWIYYISNGCRQNRGL